MRIIRLGLNPKVTALLGKLATRVRIADKGFIEDLFALYRLKGNGVPTADRLKLLVDHYAKANGANPLLVRGVLNKRKAMLIAVSKSALFQKLSNDKTDPLAAIERILVVFSKMNRKLRQIQCVTCIHLSQCDYGKQYQGKVRDITSVIDPDYKAKVNQSCPQLPAIDGVNDFHHGLLLAQSLAQQANANALAANGANPGGTIYSTPVTPPTTTVAPVQVDAAAKAEEAAQEHEPDADDSDEDPEADDSAGYVPPFEGDGGKGGDAFNVRFDGGNSQIIDEGFVDKLSAADLLMFHIAMALDAQLGTKKKGHFLPSIPLQDQSSETNIKSVSEEASIIPSQHGLPDDLREQKLEKNQLVKKKFLKPQKKKQLLYLLVDASSSMESTASMMNGIVATRAALAATFAMALVRKVMREEGIVFARFFTDAIGPLHALRTPEDFMVYDAYLSHCRFSGGGTDLAKVILAACSDISSARNEMNRAEIMMITDAQDNIDQHMTALTNKLGKIPLNVLDVAPQHGVPARPSSLATLSDNYYKIQTGSVDLSKMIDLVGGKKKGTP